MIAVVAEAATYTLGLSICQVRREWYDDDDRRTHMQLTIRFPSPDFAKQLGKQLREAKNAENNTIVNETTVTSQKDKVSVVLPSTVKEIETHAQGVMLIFEKVDKDKDKAKGPYNAKTWQQYAGMWPPRGDKIGADMTQLRLYNNWTHTRLAKAVAGPAR